MRSKTSNEPANRYWDEARVNSNNQAAAEQIFDFPCLLTNIRLMKSDRECEARACESETSRNLSN